MQLLIVRIQRCVVILIQNKIWCSLFECFCSTELFSWLFYKLWANSWKTPTMVIFTINIPTDWCWYHCTPVGIPPHYTAVTITLWNEKQSCTCYTRGSQGPLHTSVHRFTHLHAPLHTLGTLHPSVHLHIPLQTSVDITTHTSMNLIG